MPDKGSLGRDVMRGAAWIGGSRLTVRMIGFVSTLFLARLLSPEDFGLVAVAMAFVAIPQQAADFGFNQALIRLNDPEPVEYATAWTFNLLRGVVLSLALFALASPAAHLFNEPRLSLAIGVLALLPLIKGLENVRFVDYERRMNFAPAAKVMVAMKVAAFTVTLTVAFATRSYWALIVGSITSEVFRVALTYALVPYCPYPTFRGWKRLWAFSGWLSGANFLQAIAVRSDELVAKTSLATDAVGFLHMGKELTVALMQEVVGPVRRALFPGFASLAQKPDELRDAYLASVSGVFLVAAPIAAGFALVANNAVPLLLGDQWLSLIPIVQVLSATSVLALIGQQAVPLIMGTGHTKLWFQRSTVIAPLRLVLVGGGAAAAGLPGAVGGLALAVMASAVLNLELARKVSSATPPMHLFACRRSILGITVMTAVVVCVEWGFPPLTGPVGNAVVLLTKSVVGALAYVAVTGAAWYYSGQPWGAEARLLGVARSMYPLIGRLVRF
ncbi:MAG: lipopolysaccharide biosynthesis protein [Spiribacter salinus]|uniref:Lipopolysaccharide biosynthesis protein n=1 Tax=Spiribacter salinus TaxID=1335746 RepID=A0A540VTN8_9GAMM|nr:MAG: lipopolysaccharide biosynthesis protein [Spiribacter salinus]